MRVYNNFASVMRILVISFLLVSCFNVFEVLCCTTLIVGKKATEDGSVILAHNEELDGHAAQHLLVEPRKNHEKGDTFVFYSGGEIPQVEETYGYIASKIFDKNFVPGTLTSGINEFQVSIANNMAWSRDELVPEDHPWKLKENGIIWTEFTQLALERAKTAREAVKLMGTLSEKYGLSGDPGTAFGIADPSEGWFIEILRGGQWVAKRVPDNGYAMMANTFRIEEVDFESENYMCSENLVHFAVERGWYDPDSGKPFNFAEVYSNLEKFKDPYNTRRHYRVEKLLNSIIPDASVQKIASILRDHYEGTEYDKTNGYESDSPHSTSERTICRINTQISIIAQLRDWLPPEIGGVAWWAMATPCSSPYIPHYVGISKIEKPYSIGNDAYDNQSAYWIFNELDNIVDQNYGKLINDVKSSWNDFESKTFASQKSIEETASNLRSQSKSLSQWFLTNYTISLSLESLSKANARTNEFLSSEYK